MGTPILIIGNSGTGKSASMRNLDPKKTGLINVGRKPLPFKSAMKSKDTDDYKTITGTLKGAKAKTLIIDDCQYLMANEFMRRAKEKGYEKFTEIGLNFWDLVNFVIDDLDRDVTVYFMGHAEQNELGGVKFKTIGRLLDDKITIEGMFTIVLRTHVQDGRYLFSTQNDGTDTVKSPIGMFAERYIDNDLNYVDGVVREYYELREEDKGKELVL